MHKKAQSIIEYAVMLACIVFALIAMRLYITRGMQGRLRQVADDLGQAYDPRHTTSDITTQVGGHTVTTTNTQTITNPDTGENTIQTITTTNIDWERERHFGNETVEGLP